MNKKLCKYRIESARLQSWDYSSNGAYFITICTKDREHYFGEIFNGEMQFTEIGKLAEKYWEETTQHFPFVELGSFMVMPNHFHGILIINKNIVNICRNKACLVPTNIPTIITKTPGQLRFQNQGKNTVSSMVGSFKSVVSKNAHLTNANFGWQARFHDHIIRNSDEFERIQNYIANNSSNWKGNKFCE